MDGSGRADDGAGAQGDPGARVVADDAARLAVRDGDRVDVGVGLRPTDAAVAQWAADQRVFVSSVMAGYEHYRGAAIDAIEAVGATSVAFERFGGRDSDPEAAYLAEVSTSTIYVGLLGARYGKPLADRYSATHAEYNHAEGEGSRLSMWVEEGVDRGGPQQSFFEAVRVDGNWPEFPARTALNWLPEDVLALGEKTGNMINCDWVEFPLEREKEIAAALERSGYQVRHDPVLVEKALGIDSPHGARA